MAYGAIHVVLAIGTVLVAVLYNLEVTVPLDGVVPISNTRVTLLRDCREVFKYVGDLRNYGEWFPNVDKFHETSPTGMENGKRFVEATNFPLFGEKQYHIFVTRYQPPKVTQFVYDDFTMLQVTISTEQSEDRCYVDFKTGTKRTSYLFHATAGMGLKLLYSMRGRHAMFYIRTAFNSAGFQ